MAAKTIEMIERPSMIKEEEVMVETEEAPFSAKKKRQTYFNIVARARPLLSIMAENATHQQRDK